MKLFQQFYGNSMAASRALLFSTQAPTSPLAPLERMIQRLRPKTSVVPILENWVQEGNQIEHSQLQKLITDLLPRRKFFNHALQMLEWMSDRGGHELSAEEFAVRLELISRVRGIEQVKVYFDAIPHKLRGNEVYCALLTSYARHFGNSLTMLKKSEESREGNLNEVYHSVIWFLSGKKDMDGAERFWEDWFSKRKEMDFGIPRSMIYGYGTKGQWEKAEGIVLRMRESGIEPDADTLHTLASAYGECKQMDKAVEASMKAISVSEPGWIPGELWTIDSCFQYLRIQGDDIAKEELYKMLKEHCGLPTWACHDLKNCKPMLNGYYRNPRANLGLE